MIKNGCPSFFLSRGVVRMESLEYNIPLTSNEIDLQYYNRILSDNTLIGGPVNG